MFHVICRYRPDGDIARFAYRAEHLEYVIAAEAVLVFGGPLMTDEGERSTGAVFVLDLPDRPSVERFLANEPYHRNGLFASVEIHRWLQMNPQSVPGYLQRELEMERSKTASPP
ncbi:YciI family protein [Azospirillum sp. TSA6c]|uniref:YciI family protein n=1 Tax=unclassified Azospirillum TaxID=2630922 RepID=UPI000D61C951|nr:YciI family protein [Azospirillum sp. TSA6c]PWC47025.1 hypothetical protein TSA6c_09940 [Azospirillum sp. TSA6c]PWC53197.1 hypothetical protein TSA6c_02855 [Azospirillum sp. TSA6c]